MTAPAPRRAGAAALAAPDGTPGVAWHAVSAAQALAHAATPDGGLPPDEVARRRAVFGPNTMTQGARRTLLGRVWDQANNVLIWLLLASAVIEAIFQSWADMILILAVVVINVVIGMLQEGKAEEAARAISRMLAATATVVRGGVKRAVPAADVVPGDLLFVASGDRLTADVRFVATASLQTAEGALTGESVPVDKHCEPVPADAQLGDRACMGFSGTHVVYGQGTGVVTATGDAAELGRINALVSSVDAQTTPLLEQLETFGRWVAGITVALALLTFLISLLARGTPAGAAFSEAVSVAVAIIPEGLPAVTTITLALGVRHMAAQSAIIRQLPAVETLGSVSVICTDKTGTLTRNEMTVVAVHTSVGQYPVTGSGYAPEAGAVCAPDAAAGAAGGGGGGGSDGGGGGSDGGGGGSGDGGGAARVPLAGAHLARLRELLLPAVIANDASLVRAAVEHAAVSAPPPRVPVRLLGEGAEAAAAAEPAPTTVTAAAAAVPPPAEGAPAAAAPPPAAGSSEWRMTGDPTEGALLTLGLKAGVESLERLSASMPRLATIPFESDYKFMAALVDAPPQPSSTCSAAPPVRTVFLKGAYDVIISRCATQAVGDCAWTSEPVDRQRWLAAASEYARRGLRVLAVAQLRVPAGTTALCTRDVTHGAPRLQLNALVAIVDPPRAESAQAVAECKRAGITVKMITGDHPDTATTIGGWVGIETAETLTGHQLEALSDAELGARVLRCNVYARASPEHKLRIVRALQAHGLVVAMTGDGVNDAPALKQASVGVAMGITGTEVAKEAAKMILADDNFATIVKAVREGRGVYDNLRKILAFALPTNFAQCVCVCVCGWESCVTTDAGCALPGIAITAH